MFLIRTALLIAGAALLVAGCGSTTSATGGGASAAAPTSSSSSSTGAAPLLGEAQSAATGDIPDSQVFLTFRNRASGYTMEYPEGWALQGGGPSVTFRSNNNLIRVLETHGAAPLQAAVLADLSRQKAAQPGLTIGTASTQSITGAPVIKVSYSTRSALNPVTGRTVLLLVDRYVYSHGGRVATVDLATPKGVDNVDAYKKIARSFKWQ